MAPPNPQVSSACSNWVGSFRMRETTTDYMIDDFPQTQENAVFEYAEKHKAECFDQLADYVEILDFPEMTLSNWKIEKGRIALKGWFSAMLKLQQRNAEAIENGAGSITTECKGFDFSITLGDDFKIATDKETQKEIIEIKLQGS